MRRTLALIGIAVLAASVISSPNRAAAANKETKTKSLDDRNRRLVYSGDGWTTFDDLGPEHSGGTAKSSAAAKDCFEFARASCLNIKWFSTRGNDRGKAAVFIDDVLIATVDTYSPTPQATSAVFDSKDLPPGKHRIKVVVLHEKDVASSGYWVECDKIEVVTDEELPEPTALSAPAPLPGTAIDKDSPLYFGKWDLETDQDGFRERRFRVSNVQYNTCELLFKGPAVRWFGSKNKDHGHADVYLDDVLQKTVDSYSPTWISNVVLFERTGLTAGKLHTLKIVVRKERNPAATDCCQDVDCFEVANPLKYPEEIAKAKDAELAQISAGAKPFAPPETWKPVKYSAISPASGVSLRPGVLRDAFQRNIDYLNHSFASKTYCDGVGWSAWLPASIEGRMLQGAANSLRWGERADMRRIVDTVVDRIQARQRADGYHNYYPEKASFSAESAAESERKNYDRVFWTRGLLDAGSIGNRTAYSIVRKFYDWFDGCSYLPRMIYGANTPNALPGGPLVCNSPVGTSTDVVVSQRYLDQDYWINELKNGEPLCFTFYPGERPHCYDLLALEAFVDQYRATGLQKYIDAVLGGWKMYRENFEHVGGTAAICEGGGPYPPKSYKFITGCTGETCGSVFWVNINSRLLQLYPTEEKYAAEIEKVIYNVVLSCQNTKGYIRYHNRLHGDKEEAACQGTCCECSVVGLIAKLPEYIYSTDSDGLFVNLYAASKIVWKHGDGDVTVTQATSFPNAGRVALTVATATPKTMSIRIRVPSWAARDVPIRVNGTVAVVGKPGTYATIRRTWSDNDAIEMTLPLEFTTVKYLGLDQAANNVDRYALLYGPILMALTDSNGRIRVEPKKLLSLLKPVSDNLLEFRVKGTPYKFLPYWQVERNFTCFPMVEP